MKFYIGISPLLGIDSWQPMFLLGANSKKTLGGDSYGYLHFFFPILSPLPITFWTYLDINWSVSRSIWWNLAFYVDSWLSFVILFDALCNHHDSFYSLLVFIYYLILKKTWLELTIWVVHYGPFKAICCWCCLGNREKMRLSCISSYYMPLWILFRTLHGLLVPCEFCSSWYKYVNVF